MISFGDGSTGDAVTTPATSQDATCGICLKEKIIRPLVLPNCRHVFCFACIEKYQETNQAPMWRNNKTCPLCRAVTDKALHKARMELKRVEMLLDDDDIVGRRDLCNKAMLEIGALGADGGNVAALLVRADLLKHVDPLKAIKLYETLVKAARSRMRLEQQAKLHVGKAQSYKAAGLFAEALAEYRRVNEGRKKPMSAETRSEFDLGMSRCYFHLGMFKEAISKAEHYVVQERRVAGGHKIVAMALLAMAEEAKTSGAVETVFIGKNVSMTLAGAVEVAYKGLVL